MVVYWLIVLCRVVGYDGNIQTVKEKEASP